MLDEHCLPCPRSELVDPGWECGSVQNVGVCSGLSVLIGEAQGVCVVACCYRAKVGCCRVPGATLG